MKQEALSWWRGEYMHWLHLTGRLVQSLELTVEDKNRLPKFFSDLYTGALPLLSLSLSVFLCLSVSFCVSVSVCMSFSHIYTHIKYIFKINVKESE